MEHHKFKILVVDDDVSLLIQAEELLGDDYLVSLANSGEKAIEFFRKGGDADIVLLDVLMPKMDGFQVFQEIKKINRLSDVPVIFLTSLTQDESEIKALEIGGSDYIRKPFNENVLKSRVMLRLRETKKINESKISEIGEKLSKTEIEVLKLLSQGDTNEEISQKLDYSYGYVKQVVSKIFSKLDITSRKEVKKFFN